MVDTKKLIVILLIVAIVFSVVSIVLNFYVYDLSPVNLSKTTSASRSPAPGSSNVQLVVEGSSQP